SGSRASTGVLAGLPAKVTACGPPAAGSLPHPAVLSTSARPAASTAALRHRDARLVCLIASPHAACAAAVPRPLWSGCRNGPAGRRSYARRHDAGSAHAPLPAPAGTDRSSVVREVAVG